MDSQVKEKKKNTEHPHPSLRVWGVLTDLRNPISQIQSPEMLVSSLHLKWLSKPSECTRSTQCKIRIKKISPGRHIQRRKEGIELSDII